MRQKLFIFSGLIILALLLVGLNAASYVQKEKVPDDEMNANRSTYNTGATGTRAFFDLLNETGRKPLRWQEAPLALLSAKDGAPQTFVIIGPTPRHISDEELEHILRWVAQGGKLVVIDREPRQNLLSTTATWLLKVTPAENFPFGVDPTSQQQMTDKVAAGKPIQPSVFTRNVNAVQPSRFASSIALTYSGIGSDSFKIGLPTPNSATQKKSGEFKAPTMPADDSGDDIITATDEAQEEENLELTAPVVHLSSKDKNLLVDFPYGAGEIVYLSDPYIVSNAGISLVDNAQMAINVVASRGGIIAFDEYHHGYGANENRLFSYFAGTPILAILLQIVLLIGVVLFTQSRRFARALPANEPNRLSKLEYVSAMAELQQRTRAYDLALENIYSEFRRTTARFVGIDSFQTSRKDLARMIAEKADLEIRQLEELMRRCEDIIHGDPTNKKEVLDLASRLREIEAKLGLKRAGKRAFRK